MEYFNLRVENLMDEEILKLVALKIVRTCTANEEAAF